MKLERLWGEESKMDSLSIFIDYFNAIQFRLVGFMNIHVYDLCRSGYITGIYLLSRLV